MKNKNEKGITLIALVITIIILLILAGISISSLTGSGLLKKANDAKKEYEDSKKEENKILLEYEDNINKNIKSEEKGISIPERLYIEKGKTEEISAKLTGGLNGTIKWKIEDTNIATISSETGDKITLTALGENGDTTTLDVNVIYEGNTYNKKCIINIVAELSIGDYVEYGVTYTDMNTKNLFSEMTGWRVLDKGKLNNQNGMYEGTKIVSTGIPAKLYWVPQIDQNGEWFGTKEQVAKLYDTEDMKISELGYVMAFGTAGLRENFGKIKLLSENTSEGNKGFYIKVNEKTGMDNNENPIPLSENEFIVKGKARKVYNMTLEELNKARNKENDLENRDNLTANDGAKGLFDLSGLEEFGYSSTKGATYFLATPTPGSYTGIVYVYNQRIGSIGNNYATGLRPVIELSSGVYKDQNIWKIK